MKTVLELKGLKKHYPILGGVLRREVGSVKAVDGVDLAIRRGECLGVVGESGCGKTTMGKAVIKLHPPTSGQVVYHPGDGGQGVDIAHLSTSGMNRLGLRNRLQMVFQDPTTSLNPRMLVKQIIAEPIREQGRLSSRKLQDEVVKNLEMVGMSAMHLMRYPHEFSGGQRQRIAVARAIAARPEFIVLDEPTSALDVSVQAQVLNLLDDLRQELELTYMFVTHHLLVVRYIATRIVVMYLGKVMEIADTNDIFTNTMHPYTFALLSGIPNPDVSRRSKRIVLQGDTPSPVDPPSGCRFHTRCPFSVDLCSSEEPVLADVGGGHACACHRRDEVGKLVAERFGAH